MALEYGYGIEKVCENATDSGEPSPDQIPDPGDPQDVPTLPWE